MPGLLRGVARTAVVAGTATAVSNRVSRRQARRWGYMDDEPQQEPQQAYAPPPPPPQQQQQQEEDPIAKLREYAKLRDDGILTDEEFEAQKRRLLG
jgi:hypothetical protein